MPADKAAPTATASRPPVIGPAGPMFGTPQAPRTVSVSAAAAHNQDLHHHRRMSLGAISTAFPLTGPGITPSPVVSAAAAAAAASNPATWARRASISSSLGSDESALDDGPDAGPAGPPTPLSRRLSAGANGNLLRGFRPPGPASPNGTASSLSARVRPRSVVFGSSPPPVRGRALDGFNFAENFRSRAERASMSSAAGLPPYPTFGHRRRASMATTTAAEAAAARPAPVAAPAPAPATRPARPAQGLPDPIQERILKGDFYMD